MGRAVTTRPTIEDIRAEAKRRVDARHRGFLPPARGVLADEYEREELYVACLARQFSWSEIVPIPVAEIVQLGSGCSVRKSECAEPVFDLLAALAMSDPSEDSRDAAIALLSARFRRSEAGA